LDNVEKSLDQNCTSNIYTGHKATSSLHFCKYSSPQILNFVKTVHLSEMFEKTVILVLIDTGKKCNSCTNYLILYIAYSN